MFSLLAAISGCLLVPADSFLEGLGGSLVRCLNPTQY